MKVFKTCSHPVRTDTGLKVLLISTALVFHLSTFASAQGAASQDFPTEFIIEEDRSPSTHEGSGWDVIDYNNRDNQHASGTFAMECTSSADKSGIQIATNHIVDLGREVISFGSESLPLHTTDTTISWIISWNDEYKFEGRYFPHKINLKHVLNRYTMALTVFSFAEFPEGLEEKVGHHFFGRLTRNYDQRNQNKIISGSCRFLAERKF